jgi:hypothetical protein
LCILNVCKPQEYPGLLSSYVHRKIDLILIKKEIKKKAISFLISHPMYLLQYYTRLVAMDEIFVMVPVQ